MSSSVSLFKEDYNYIHKILKEELPLDKKLSSRSIPIPNTKENGFSAIYRNAASPDRVIETFHPSLTTFYDVFKTSVELYGDRKCLGHRKFDKETNSFENEYTWESYKDCNNKAQRIGSGILNVMSNNPFRSPAKDYNSDFIVSFFSSNRPEWLLADLACASYSLTSTALYNTLGHDASKYILELTESPILICSKDKIEDILSMKADRDLETLICVISMDSLDPNDGLYLKSYQSNIMLYDFTQLAKIGELNPSQIRPPSPEDLYTISFTSGTTGSRPKGVMLTHKGAVAGLTNTLSCIDCPPNTTSFCLLPLAHIYERLSSQYALAHGAAIGFPQSASPLTIFDDIKILKPSHLSIVPRIFTKLEAALKEKLFNQSSSFKAGLIRHVVDVKTQMLAKNEGIAPVHRLYDNTIIKKIREQIGFTNVSACITASAPISPETVIFLRSLLNIGILQGYGLTESFAGVSMSDPYDINPGSCGPIGVTCEMKIKDVPEMGYTSNDKGGPRGEILLRGPQMLKGYYKNEEETAKCLDKDGWFYTGDVGRIDENGKLVIIDRVKNFFKLAQGEYITPEKIENNYLSACPLISQVYVHGDSLKNYLVAIVGIDPQIMSRFLATHLEFTAEELGTDEKLVSLLKDARVKAFLLRHMNDSVNKLGLQGFEKIHNIHCDIEPLTVEKNVITPTLKIKRPIAFKHFKDIFESLYSEGSLVHSSKL